MLYALGGFRHLLTDTKTSNPASCLFKQAGYPEGPPLQHLLSVELKGLTCCYTRYAHRTTQIGGQGTPEVVRTLC